MIKLDFDRPYTRIYSSNLDYSYQQDGGNFDGKGECLKEYESIVKAAREKSLAIRIAEKKKELDEKKKELDELEVKLYEKDRNKKQGILSEIYFANFKCFREHVLSPGPLTLFTGHNAAGKSTSIQSILLLSRIFKTGSASISLANEGINTGSDNINIGSFGEMLNDKATENKVEFRVKIASMEPGENRRELVKVTFFIKDFKEGFESNIKLTDLIISKESPDGGHDNSQEINLDEHPDLNDTSHIHEIHKESYLEFIRIIRNVIYISAERTALQDVFPKVTDANSVFADVGAKGRYASWWFDTYSDKEIDEKKLCQSETAETLRRQVYAWLGKIFPGAQANAISIPDTNLIRQQFRISDYQGWKRPGNIGYGISYIFPVIVSALLARKGQVMIVDSPEAHLHPAGQSVMGQFFAATCRAGTGSV